jgi:hypothetical protein
MAFTVMTDLQQKRKDRIVQLFVAFRGLSAYFRQGTYVRFASFAHKVSLAKSSIIDRKRLLPGISGARTEETPPGHGSCPKCHSKALDMIKRDDYLLLALAESADGSLTPVQIQKAMFLLKEEAGGDIGKNFYKFIPYNYGPFCSDIYQDLTVLESNGLVITDKSKKWPIFTITKNGLEKAKHDSSSLNKSVKKYMPILIGWIKGQTFSSLLQAVYKKYPNYAVNSVFNK